MVMDVEERVRDVSSRIESALLRAGREPGAVTIMAVTKTHPYDAVLRAVDAGITVIGENRVQETEKKVPGDRSGYELHLVGHLQRNKAKRAVRLFDSVDSIDKAQTAGAIAGHCREMGKKMGVYVEYNTSGEAAKSGVSDPDALFTLLEEVLRYEELTLRGLMTVGPLTDDRDRLRSAFRTLFELAQRTEARFADCAPLELSMGMSGDFEIAIEEGATMVRLGTVLFGRRETA